MLDSHTVQHGYRESYEEFGITDAKEVDLSLVHRREIWEGQPGVALHQVSASLSWKKAP